jgi:hypothetical protein
MSGAIPQLLLHTIMKWTGTTLAVFCLSSVRISRYRLCLRPHNWQPHITVTANQICVLLTHNVTMFNSTKKHTHVKQSLDPCISDQ